MKSYRVSNELLFYHVALLLETTFKQTCSKVGNRKIHHVAPRKDAILLQAGQQHSD